MGSKHYLLSPLPTLPLFLPLDWCLCLNFPYASRPCIYSHLSSFLWVLSPRTCAQVTPIYLGASWMCPDLTWMIAIASSQVLWTWDPTSRAISLSNISNKQDSWRWGPAMASKAFARQGGHVGFLLCESVSRHWTQHSIWSSYFFFFTQKPWPST